MKIVIIFFLFPVYHQTIQIIGPSFISTFNSKQKIYYNNLGIRLDCLSRGQPLPIISWFRMNSSDDRLLIPIYSSKLTEIFSNGSLFIRSFQDYFKPIHAGIYLCQAKNPAGSIQSFPIQIKPQMHDAYEIEVQNPYGFIQSSVIISCEISPPIASSYVNIIGWLEKINEQIIELDLRLGNKYNLLLNKKLIIHNLTKFDDNRSYACIIQNQINNQTKTSRFKTLRVRDRSPFGPELSIANNTEYHVQAGELIELPCGIASYSLNAKISWWKDGKPISNINQDFLILQISFSSINDSGMYICQIDDDDESIGRFTSAMFLKVHLPLQCQINIQQINIHHGLNQELSCSINSIQTSSSDHWQWYHNSNLLTTKFNRYTITNATRKHMGMYQCCYMRTSTYANGCCAQTQIHIINSPPILLPETEIHRNSIVIIPKNLANISIDLNCTIYSNPLSDINIYKDGEKLLLNHKHIDYLLTGDVFIHYTIQISNLNDTGLYECRAMNSFGSISFSKHINIEQEKPLIRPLKNLSKQINDEINVFCYASGQPYLRLQWIDLNTNRILNTSSTSPIVLSTKCLQSNIYSCRAENIYGEITSNMFVNVENPARILSITPNRTIKINETIEIYCLTQGDYPLELTFQSPFRKNRYENQRNLSFIIEHIQIFDSGLYICSIKNHYSQDQMSFELIVQNIPNKIEHIFVENLEKISWMKSFDGHSKIFRYLIRVRCQENSSWSNETIIQIENTDTTFYSFENIFSQNYFFLTIQAENAIGMSIPSDVIQFQTKAKQLSIIPYNLHVVNISSTTIRLSWQYSSLQICTDSILKFIVEYNGTQIETVFKEITIDRLRSFTFYSFTIYAINELGSSPKSKSLLIRTGESVPFGMITDLSGYLLNSSTAFITWSNNTSLLNGIFRTYAVSIYENFNMSTLTTIETINSNLILSNLHCSSQYFFSVSICNHFDCGSSSSAIHIRTPTLSNQLSSSKISLTKPSTIRAKIHFIKSNEIGLKILYPSEIIENLIISYKIQHHSLTKQLNISPPLLNIRLNHLLCGNNYEIWIHTSNQIGTSMSEYLVMKTDGSVPRLINSKDLFETIAHDYIILNMNNWFIDECQILSYEITLDSNRYISSNSRYRIDNLRANHDYKMLIKIVSEAGEINEFISFRTIDDYERIQMKNEQLILMMICIATIVLTLVCVCIISQFRRTKKQSKKRLKPIGYKTKNQRSRHRVDNSLTIVNHRSNSFTSEDSQGNINPYAVTGYSTERYFCPIVLESNKSTRPCLLTNLSTISSPDDSGVHSTYQDNQFYETYDQTVRPQYSLV